MTPLVSAIIPTRNRRDKLNRALGSIAAQSFRDFEVLVVDDGSEDGTPSWLCRQWPSVSLIQVSPSIGAAAARNLAISRARGEFVAFLDDDDLWLPSYLEVQVAQFRAHPDADLCTTSHIEVTRRGAISNPDLVPVSAYPNQLVLFLAACPIHTLSVVACRRTAFEGVGPLDQNFSIAHDLDWYTRLISMGGEIQHFPEALVERSVPGGLVTRHRQWYREERKIQQSIFAAGSCSAAEQRLIRVSRALFFARLGFERGDLLFAGRRLGEAFWASPLAAFSITTRRLVRLIARRAAWPQPMQRKEAR